MWKHIYIDNEYVGPRCNSIWHMLYTSMICVTAFLGVIEIIFITNNFTNTSLVLYLL